jgi:threonine/homoserine/homoserine lactone efflux protein
VNLAYKDQQMVVLASLGALILVCGAAVAVAGEQRPRYARRLQRWGGGLFLAGAALLGLAFPLMI